MSARRMNNRVATDLMKMRSTPFCGMFTSMTIEYSEEALTSYGVKVDNEGMRVFHRATSTLVFRNTYTKCWMIRRVTIENLYYNQLYMSTIKMQRTPWVSKSAVVIDFERASGESENMIVIVQSGSVGVFQTHDPTLQTQITYKLIHSISSFRAFLWTQQTMFDSYIHSNQSSHPHRTRRDRYQALEYREPWSI